WSRRTGPGASCSAGSNSPGRRRPLRNRPRHLFRCPVLTLPPVSDIGAAVVCPGPPISVASGTRPTESATPRSSDDTRVEVQCSMSQPLPALANRLITRLALPVVLTLALNPAPAGATPVSPAGNLPYSGISPGGVDMSTGELILVMRPDLAIDGP